MPAGAAGLNIQIFRVLGVFFNEESARVNVVAHKDGESFVALLCVLHCHLKQGTSFGIHCSFPELFGVHFAETFVTLGFNTVRTQFDDLRIALFVGESVTDLLALEHLIQRRLSEENVTVLDELTHITEQERKYEYADVRTVDIGICHDDDFTVTQFACVEIVADAASERLNYREQGLVCVNLVGTALFNVKYLAAQREYCLIFAVASVFCRSACGVTLNDVKFG